jgi:methionyl-tRNA formyltransferase
MHGLHEGPFEIARSKKEMNILFLGRSDSKIYEYLLLVEDTVLFEDNPIKSEFIKQNRIDFLVSHGYWHIIKKDVLDLLPRKSINLHIALLPWNRGADPNLWSVIEETPPGVTIHYIDEGIDTGPIIAQKYVPFQPGDTLKTSYDRLQSEMYELFKREWPNIKQGQCTQVGSYHQMKDKKRIEHLLVRGWDTPVELLGK